MEEIIEQYEIKYKDKAKNAVKMEQNLLSQISKLKNTVIKPLYHELKVKDEIIKRYKKEFELNMRDMKMLKIIIKIPVLCQEF